MSFLKLHVLKILLQLRIFRANHYQHVFHYETERQVLKILYQVCISEPIIIGM